ncbi:MAG: PEGA domain-containing protein [Bacteroidales bacterium]|nr:PEGA domain-containing protein [Bacteroidales bacterium]
MKTKMSLAVPAVLMSSILLFASCGSSTLIHSVPSGAKIYIDDRVVGVTPYEHYDTKIVGSRTRVRLQKEGYEDLRTTFSRSEELDAGALIGGLFFYIPVLWIMGYERDRTYELMPIEPETVETEAAPAATNTNGLDNYSQLYRLKQMLDDGILTQDEYDAEKKKLLSN